MQSKTKKSLEIEVIKTLIFDSFGASTEIGEIVPPFNRNIMNLHPRNSKFSYLVIK